MLDSTGNYGDITRLNCSLLGCHPHHTTLTTPHGCHTIHLVFSELSDNERGGPRVTFATASASLLVTASVVKSKPNCPLTDVPPSTESVGVPLKVKRSALAPLAGCRHQ